VPVLLDSYLYEGDTVIVKGQTQNFEAVNALKKALEQTRSFKEVAIRSTELGKKDGQVSFEMKMVVR
jgi:Tfp pilus assembly protein PilN